MMAKPKALILVDVQNVYYTTRQTYKRNFDYNRFWAKVSADFEITKAIAYAVDRGDQKQREFQNILRAIGFEVKLKPYIQRADGSAKGDWDVGITIDAIEESADVDTVILVSGDGDFDRLALHLRNNKNKQFIVYSVEALTAASLINAVDQHVGITIGLLI